MQVKLFISESTLELEHQVNNFIEGKTIVNLQFRHTASDAKTKRYSMMVAYHPKEEKDKNENQN